MDKKLHIINMSKKIRIDIPNKIKPNLNALFHKYLSRKAKEPSSILDDWDEDEYEDMAAYWDQVFPGWDDDDTDVVFPPSKGNVVVMKPRGNDKDKVKRTKHKHVKGKHKKLSTCYDDEFDFGDNYGIEDYRTSNNRLIYFYPDYHDKYEKLEFNSLKEFTDYCDSMCYWIDEQVLEDISWRYESHCCINPESAKEGLIEIMSEYTYGEMFYEACEEAEIYNSDN